MITLTETATSLKKESNRSELFFSLRRFYIVVFFSYIMLSRLLTVSSVLSEKFNSALFLGFALLGTVILFLGVTVKGENKFSLDNLLLLGFVVTCSVSSALNMSYGITDNVKTIGWTVLQFFLIYAISWNMSKEEMKREFDLLAKSLSAIWFAEIAVSMYQFFFQIGYYTLNEQGKKVRQGFYDERLFGIFADPNYAGVTSVIVIILSAYCAYRAKNRLAKLFFQINCVLSFLYIVLCGSRTAEVAGLIGLFLFSWNFIRIKLRAKKARVTVQNILSPLLALLCCVVMVEAVAVTKEIMAYVPPLISGDAEKRPVDLHRPDVEDSTDISNLRFDIWKGALEIWTSKPVFGVSPRNFTTYAIQRFPQSFVAHKKYSVHNGYLALLVCTGIVGFLLMAAFIVLNILRVWRFVRRKWNDSIPTFYILCLMVIGAIAFSAITLLDIFFANSLNTNLFWLLLGYLAKLSAAPKQEPRAKWMQNGGKA